MSGYTDPEYDEMAALNADLAAYGDGDVYDLSALDPGLQAELDAAEAELAAAGYALDSLPPGQPLPDLGAAEAQRQAEDAQGMPMETEARTAYLMSRVERGTYLPPAPYDDDAHGCGPLDDFGRCCGTFPRRLLLRDGPRRGGKRVRRVGRRLAAHPAGQPRHGHRPAAGQRAAGRPGRRAGRPGRPRFGGLPRDARPARPRAVAVAINRYVLTSTVTVGTGTAATVVAGEPGTGSPAGPGNAATTGGPLWPTTYQQGQLIELDPAGTLFAAIGSGNLRAYVQGSDDVGHQALANWRHRARHLRRRHAGYRAADRP